MKQRNFLLWPFLLLTLAFSTFTSAQEPTIKVEIKTLRVFGPVRSEALPRVKVEIGNYSTTTDERGRGSIMVPPGEHFTTVSGPCQLNSISTIGSVRSVGGTNKDLRFEFPLPSNQSPTVTFQFRCDTDLIPGMVRVKIATRTSCADDPNGEVKLQSGVTVRIGDKTYTSDANGVIDVDIPPGTYPVSGVFHDYGLGYVTQNGIRQTGGESGQLSVTLSEKVETLEVRMFTCDQTGQEKARAEIVEIGVTQMGPGSIEVRRSRASGNGFVGMKLRDGDTVRINGTAKLKWLARNSSTINFDNPRESTVIVIGPDREPSGSKPDPNSPSLFRLLKGMGTFFLDPNSRELLPGETRDGNGIILSPNVKIFIKGTTLSVAHDEQTQVTTVTVVEGVVSVEPTNTALRPFELRTGQRAEISPTGVTGPTAAGQGGLSIKTSKAVYAPGETIEVEYSNPKGSGWDRIGIALPNGSGEFNGRIASINPAEQALKERNGKQTFSGLPEGDYDAFYISWAGRNNDRGGDNDITGRVRFKVGNAPPGPPPPVTPPTPPSSPSNDLTGLWRNPGGNVTYRLRQIGSRLYWGADGVPMMSFANIYYGDIKGNLVDGIWIDLPGSPYVGDGKIFLRIESDCRLVKTAEVNHYANEIWVRKNSPCDGGPVGPAPTNDLTGLWKNPGGDATYRFRQVGSKLHWGVDGVPIKSFANKFEGDVIGNVIEGKWVDLPGSPIVADGTLYLKVESECRIVKTGEVNHYGAQVWVKRGSICDVVGLPQKSSAAGTTKTNPPPAGKDRVVVSDPFAKNPARTGGNTTTGPTNKPKPKVEEIPDGVIDSGPTGKTTTAGTKTNRSTKPVPKVEKIPDDETAATITKKPTRQKPKIEEIPDGEITVAKNDDDNNVFINETTTTEEQTPPVKQQPKQEKPAKPKREGPGIWEKLGTAINTTITQPPTTQGGTTTQQPGQPGTCRGGSYWLGTPPPWKHGPGAGVQIPWSSPFITDRHNIRLYRAGTNQQISHMDIPQNANACGPSWHFYPAVGEYDAYLFLGNSSTNPVAGPVRVIVTP